MLAYLEVLCRAYSTPAQAGPSDPDDVEMEQALARIEAEGGRADAGTST